jgi:AraC family L-rhamnose operon transcriptional activator RhaR
MVRLLPHAPGYTISTDGFMDESQLVGFHVATQSHVFMHFHDFFELALVTHGTGLHMTADGEQRISRGSVIFVTPGVGHGFRAGEGLVVFNCILRVEATQFDLPWARRDESLGRLFGTSAMETRQPLLWRLDEAELGECLSHLEAIRGRSAEERNEAFDLGHLLLALDVLVRHVEPDRPEPVAIDPQASALVVAAIDQFDQDLSRQWTLRELSSQLCVGPFHLVRQFDRWVDLPPMAFLSRRRADRAAILLATTEEPIASVGAEVGWPDPSQFSRRFKQYVGMSPSAYRAQSRVHYAARRRRRNGLRAEA